MPISSKTRRFKHMGPLQNLLLEVSGRLHPSGVKSIPWLAREVLGISSEALYKHLRRKDGGIPLDRAVQLEKHLADKGYPIVEGEGDPKVKVINRKTLCPDLFK